MKRILLLALIIGVVILVILSVVVSRRKTSSQRELNDYKAKLIAQGEKLTWEEFGYPRAAESNDCMPRLGQAVALLTNRAFSPGTIKMMDLSLATNVRPCWAKDRLFLKDKDQPELAWAEFQEEMEFASVALADIRSALSNPPSFCMTDPTNFALIPPFQFVDQRKAAQWLSAETIFALRQRNMERVRENLWALRQMIHLQENDLTFVSQMIRVAIAGLALSDTWEALQSTEWSEHGLAELQQGWERINLFANLERGFLGERLFLNAAFQHVRASGKAVSQLESIALGPSSGATTAQEGFRYYWQMLVVLPIWRSNVDADELLALRHDQNCLESARRLNQGIAWPKVDRELDGLYKSFDTALSEPMAGIRYALSAIAIPNGKRAASSAVRNETLRRLAVVAIALKRYQMQNHSQPPTLEALVPNFISALPSDPMSGKALCYRVDSSTGFVLYSVGEDGVDDGGQATAVTPASGSEIWYWKDWVWPTTTVTNQ